MRGFIIEDPVSRSAQWARRSAVFAVAIAAVAVVLSRLHAIDPTAALTVFGAALTLAALAILLALWAAEIIWREGLRGAEQATLAFLLAAGLLGYPLFLTAAAVSLPQINDVSTDLKSPPSFLPSARAREARGGNEVQPPADATLAAQRTAYPDIRTAMVAMDPTQAYQMALQVAESLGWGVVDSAPPNLNGDGSAVIEATAKTLIFGFPIDIAIRIRPGADRTAIDLRSVTRVGRHDFGANAKNIRRFLAEVEQASRNGGAQG